MKINATFRGINERESGYRTGQRYNLVVTPGHYAPGISVDSPVKRKYDGLAAFLADWQSVTLVGEP